MFSCLFACLWLQPFFQKFFNKMFLNLLCMECLRFNHKSNQISITFFRNQRWKRIYFLPFTALRLHTHKAYCSLVVLRSPIYLIPFPFSIFTGLDFCVKTLRLQITYSILTFTKGLLYYYPSTFKCSTLDPSDQQQQSII